MTAALIADCIVPLNTNTAAVCVANTVALATSGGTAVVKANTSAATAAVSIAMRASAAKSTTDNITNIISLIT